MEAIILPVTIVTAAACAFVNIWLAVRIGAVRRAENISIGDGGNSRLIARMRAQLNFAEYAPIVLILMGLIELAVGTETWLWLVAGAFITARILHPIGMDGWGAGRVIGIALTLLVTIGLAGYAASIPFLALDDTQTIVAQ
ncbi:MAPEG family protein [Sphingomonas sp. ST-64]|uniref:MAPEG family protein n=1 Tax=Sphingomonas plantiphila TaxID=3163295 RepID=A0ABW8YLC3_9SPHN